MIRLILKVVSILRRLCGLERKVKGILTGGKTLFSRAAKGLPALGRGNGETHRVGSEKIVLPAVLVSIKYVYQHNMILRCRRKRERDLAIGVKPRISKNKQLRVSELERNK